MDIVTVIIFGGLMILGAINGFQDSQLMYGAIVTPLCMLPLFFMQRSVRPYSHRRIVYLFIGGLVLIDYIARVFGGASSPDGAGHMAIVLWPLVIGLLSLFIWLGVKVCESLWAALNKSKQEGTG